MTIRAGPGDLRKVAIRKEKNGAIVMLSEESTAISKADKLRGGAESGGLAELTAKLVLATRYELELLQAVPNSGIAIRENFLTTDGYASLDSQEKNKLWLQQDAKVTYVTTNNAHYINGQGPVAQEEVLIRYNLGLKEQEIGLATLL